MGIVIKTPSERFNGKRCGIDFIRGVAEVVELSESQHKSLIRLGYEVIEEKPKPAAKPKAEAKAKPKATPKAKAAAKGE